MTIDDAVREAVRLVVREELAPAVEQLLAEIRRPQRASSKTDLSTHEAADRAGVTAATIRQWVREKKLRGHLVGRRLRIRASALEELLTAPQDDVEKAVVLALHRGQKKEK